MDGLPETSATTARSHSSSPSSPMATSASAPTGAEQPASRVARRLRSAVTADRVSASSSTARTSAVAPSSARHSQAKAPWPGAGRIWSGSSSSVASSARPRRLSPAKARTTASTSPLRTLAMRVSTLPRMGTTVRPKPKALIWAVRRGEPVPMVDPAGSSPKREVVAGDDGVARIFAGRDGGQREPRIGRRREVLQRVDGEVDFARDDGFAQRRRRRRPVRRGGQRSRLVAVALSGDGDEFDVDAGLVRAAGRRCAETAWWRVRWRGCPDEACERHSTSPPTRVTASTAAGSSANRSVSASA